MPRWAAIIGAYVIVFSILGFGIATLAPRISNQGREFMANLPTYTASVKETGTDLSRKVNRLRLPEDIQAKINEEATAFGARVTEGLGGLLIALVTYLPWLVLVPILAFFFLKDVNQFRLAVLRMFPAGRWRLRAESVLQDVNTTLAAYTRAQLLSCLIIGVLCTVGFLLIGVKYALLLGLLAGIFEFVPLIGPACLFIIAVSSAAFSDNPSDGFWVAGFLVVLRITHDYITYPRIVRGGVHLHPILIILSVLAGEQVAGIPGVFLAIPIVAILTVIYRHALEHQGSRGLFDGLIEAEDERAEEIV